MSTRFLKIRKDTLLELGVDRDEESIESQTIFVFICDNSSIKVFRSPYFNFHELSEVLPPKIRDD